MTTDSAPSAVTHECPGGCGREIEAALFACKPCYKKLPYALREAVSRTRRLKYLHADRLAAVHAAEDYLDSLKPKPPVDPNRAMTNAMAQLLEGVPIGDVVGALDLAPNIPAGVPPDDGPYRDDPAGKYNRATRGF